MENVNNDSEIRTPKPVFFRRPFKYSYFNATLAIIIINLCVFLLEIFTPNIKFYCSLNVGCVIYRKMYWQFLTYMFVHQGWSHILLNMLGLFIFGSGLEKAIGSKEFILFYFVSGILSGLFSFIVYFFTGSLRVALLGASGAIYGVLFAYAVCFPRSTFFIWGILPIKAPIFVLVYTIIELAGQFFSSSNVRNSLHIVCLF